MTDTTTETAAADLEDALGVLHWLLTAWLEQVADEAERHEAQGMGNSQDEIIYGPCLAVARVVNGAAS